MFLLAEMVRAIHTACTITSSTMSCSMRSSHTLLNDGGS